MTPQKLKEILQIDPRFAEWLAKNLPPVEKPKGTWEFLKKEYRPS